MIGHRLRRGAEEFVQGAFVALCAGAGGVLISAATHARLDAALLAALVGSGGRRLAGQGGALACAVVLGASLGGVPAGHLTMAMALGFAVAFGELARSEAWSLGHARGAGKFALAFASAILIQQLFGFLPNGPVVVPTLIACGLMLVGCVLLEGWRAFRAGERRAAPRRPVRA